MVKKKEPKINSVLKIALYGFKKIRRLTSESEIAHMQCDYFISRINEAPDEERDSDPELQSLRSEVVRLRSCLEVSVKLQSHYAELLNIHDGGKRVSFDSIEAWIGHVKSLVEERCPGIWER